MRLVNIHRYLSRLFACWVLLAFASVAQAQVCPLGNNRAASGSYALAPYSSTVTVSMSRGAGQAAPTFNSGPAYTINNVNGTPRTIPAGNYLRGGDNRTTVFTINPPVPANRLVLLLFDYGPGGNGTASYTPYITITPAGGATANDFSFSSVKEGNTQTNSLTWVPSTGRLRKTNPNGTVRESGAIVGNSDALVSRLTLVGNGFSGQGDLVGYALVSVPTCVTTQKVTENSTGTFTFVNTNLVTPSGAAAASGTITTTAPNTARNGDLTMVREIGSDVVITETLPASPPGWRLAGAGCIDQESGNTGRNGGSFGNLSDATLTIPSTHLPPPANLVCTFRNVLDQPDLTLQKSSNGPWQVGQTDPQPRYRLTVTNQGTYQTFGTITVRDKLPSGITASSGTYDGWDCTVSGQDVTCTSPANPAGFSVGVGESSTFELPVTIGPAASGSITNTASTGGGGDPANGGQAPDPANCSSDDAHCATRSDDVQPMADLSIRKTADPDGTYVPGNSLKYTIVVRNDGPNDATGVKVDDTVPSSVIVSSWSCAFTTGASCGDTTSGTTNTIALTNAELPVGGELIITVNGAVDLGATGDIVNTATVTPPDGLGCSSPPCNKSSTTSNGNVGEPALRIQKTATPGAFAKGGSGTYSILVGNSGNSSTNGNIDVTDPMPTGITINLPVTANGWDCSASTTSQLDCTYSAVLLPGSNAPVINVPIAVGISAENPTVNTASASGGGTTGAVQDSTTTPVNAPRIEMTKTLDTPFVVDQETTYTITIRNTGQASSIAGGTIEDQLPVGVTVGTLPAGCHQPTTAPPGAHLPYVICTVPSIPVGGSYQFVIPVTPQASAIGENLRNLVSANGDLGDTSCPEDKEHCEAITDDPVRSPQLLLTKNTSDTSFVVGQTAQYILTLTNTGDTATTAVTTVKDTIPAALAVNTATLPAGCTFDPDSRVLTCTVATGLAAGADVQWSIDITPQASANGQSVTNQATATGGGDGFCAPGTPLEDLPPRCAPSTTTPINAPQLALEKSASDESLTVGVPAYYVLKVTNTGTAATSGTITITDRVPDGLTIGNLPSSCTAQGQQVTCTSSDRLAVGESLSFTIPFTPTAAAKPAVTNKASASGGGDPSCPNGDNCNASVTTPVDAPSLALSKSNNGPWVVGQAGAQYLLTVTNEGDADTHGTITVADDLPSQIAPDWSGTHVSNDWSCTYSGQRVTCTTSTVIAVDASSTFVLPVQVNGSGSITNKAAVGGGGDPAVSPNPNPAACQPNDAHCAENTILVNTAAAITTEKALTHINGNAASDGDPVKAGDVLTYTITSTNSGEVAGSTNLADHVPMGTTYTGDQGTPPADDPAWNCEGTAAGNECTQTQAVPANGQASSTFTVTVDTPAPAGGIANAVTSSADDDCTACSTSNPVLLPSISLAKTVGSSPMVVGQANSYTLTVSNSGQAVNSQAIVVRDTLPGTLSIGTLPTGCELDPADSQTVVCTIAAEALAVGASQSFTIPVTPTAAAAGSVTNNATATGGGGEPDDCNGSGDCAASVTTPVNTPAAITTQKVLSQINGQPAAAGASVEAGDVLTYTITSSNSGETAGSTLLTEHVPVGTTYTGIGGIDDPAWACENDEVVAGTECTQTQTVPPNGQTSSTFTVTVNTPAPPGGVANAVTSSADDDCTACSTSNPVLLPSISLAKTVGSSPMVVGQANSYILTVSNGGQAANSQPIVVRDTLPGTLSIGALPAGCELDPADSQTVVCTIAAEALAVGASQSFTIPVTPTTAGSVTNNATATGGGGEPDDCNGSGDCAASVTTPVNTPAAISTQKVLSHINGQPVSPGAGVAAGDVLTYTITTTNAGETAGSTLLTDHVPVGTTYTGIGGIDDPAWACENDEVVAGTQCTQTQAVPPNGQTSSTFTVTVDTPAPAGGIANAITSSADADCTACSTSNPARLPSISLAKTAGSSPMVVGQANSYTLTVNNSGDAANSQPIVVRDTLPATLTIGTLPAGCALDPADSQTVVCTIDAGSLAAGGSQSFTIPVTPTAAGSVTNNATATGGGGEPDDCNGSGDCAASVTTPVNTPAAISTQKVLSHINGQPVSPGAGVAAGDVLTYTITTTNAGETAGSTLLTDHVPVGTTYTGIGGIDDPAWACENDEVVAGTECTQTQAVPANGQASSTFTVTVDTPALPGSIANAVTSSADAACTACSTSNPVLLPSISLAKTAGSSPMVVGQANSYTLTVSNSGDAANSQPIVVRDTLPGTLAIGTLPAGCALDPADSQTVGCTIDAGSLAAGASQSFTIPVTPTPAATGSVTNTATATGGGGEPDDCTGSGDCTASVTTPVQEVAPPGIAKSATRITAPLEGVRWTVVLHNRNETVQQVQMRDAVPAGLTYLVGSVTCTAHGASQVNACDFDPAGNRIVADVTLAPDPGVTDPAAASNRVEVVFDTGYTDAPVPVSNTAQACWNEQNDAGAIETCAQNVPAQAGYQPPAAAEPIPTPVDARWMLAVMSLLLVLGAAWRLRRRT